MYKIDARNHVGIAVADLTGNVAKQAAFASRVAVSRTATKVKVAVTDEMRSKFDRPMPITMKSIMSKPATSQQPWAIVWLKDGQLDTSKSLYAMRDIIGHQFTGGERMIKRLEMRLQRMGILPPGMFVVPGKAAPLDAYGGIQRGEITKLLTQLGAAGDGISKSMSARTYSKLAKQGALISRGSKQRRVITRSQYIVVKGKSGTNIGIWKLISKGNVQCVLAFVRKPNYRKLIDFDGISQRIVEAHLASEFNKAFEQAMANSSHKGAWR